MQNGNLFNQYLLQTKYTPLMSSLLPSLGRDRLCGLTYRPTPGFCVPTSYVRSPDLNPDDMSTKTIAHRTLIF